MNDLQETVCREQQSIVT